MTSSRKKQHTLSDLLADDVRDYFLREGVTEPPQGRYIERSFSDIGRNTRRGVRSDREGRQNRQTPQKRWKTLTASDTSFSPLRMENFDQEVIIEDEQNSTSTAQSIQTQQRGQNTAERPKSDRNSSNGSWQMHRRHSSGSGSFSSWGSNSSYNRNVSAADAEFLRRYAEERERTNMRMQTSRVNHPPTISVIDLSPPRHPGGGNYPSRSSPRPPTVTGSHRPGLASIDNDDWEEDDRIERRDIQKKSRRDARQLDRHRRKQSSIDGSVGAASFVRQNTTGSVNEIIDYSVGTSSASNLMQQVYSEKENMNRTRHVRPLSYLSASSESGESGGDAGETSREEARESNAHFTRPSPPQNDSYYSVPPREHEFYYSETTGTDSYHHHPPSGNDSYFSRQTATTTPYFTLTPSPLSANSFGGRKFTSSDTSTMHSSLRGSSIYSAASSKERNYVTGYATNANTRGYNLRRRPEDDESSEGSYVSYESDESSYTSDDCFESFLESNGSPSYADSQNHWERVGRDYRDAKKGHHDCREAERGSHDERQMLLNKISFNYSSVSDHQQEKTRKKSRGIKSRRKRRPEKLRVPPLRLDDAIGVVWKKMCSLRVLLELLISNCPSLIGSLALAWTSLGVDWFKWYEESANDCVPIDYHDEACVYPEFAGCFACDTTRTGYWIMLNLHHLCNAISFVLASCLIGKILVAFPVVRDELANPTTAAPLGLLCMAFDKVFAGNFGYVGEAITFMSATLQTIVLAW